MRARARSLLPELARAAPRGSIALITAPIAPVSLEHFARTPIASVAADRRDLVWWSPRNDGERVGDWSFVGLGAACRIDARGRRRFVDIRDGIAPLLARVVEGSPAAGDDAPSIRVFGGAAFRPGACSRPEWRGFDEASFVLPRWLYARRGERALLRLAVPVDEVAASESAIIAEVDGVCDWLEGATSVDPEARRPPPSVVFEDETPYATWVALVESALSRIARGDFEKVVVARRHAVECAGLVDVPATLARLVHAELGCSVFAVGRGDGVFLGATPERLAAVTGGVIRTEALAGSLPRRGDGAELMRSEKDGREHAAVVDGLRESLRGVAAGVRVTSSPTVRSLRTVHHLCTPITAHAREGIGLLEVVDALHPSPAVCGLPREAADAWLTPREPLDRGWYASPVGWVDAAGDGEMVVAIRSAIVRGRSTSIFAGAGIVAGSDPAREWREVALKETAMLAGIGAL